jgi:hypothetical protein
MGVTIMELALRWFVPTFDPSGQVSFVANADGLILGAPNQLRRQSKNTGDYDVEVRFNTHGFRDMQDVVAARSDDIVVVGDSFAFGWGVEEAQRFSNVLQSLINKRVFNVAIGGGDLDQYDSLLKYAESLGGRFGNVVITVCMENDLGLYGRRQLGETHQLRTAYWRPNPTLRGLKSWLASNSATYRMFTAAVQQNALLRELAVRANLLVPNLDGIGRNVYSHEAIESSANRLAEIAQSYENATILIVPSRALWVGENRAVEDRVHRDFIAALTARKLEVIDMRHAFESNGNPLSFHFRNDGHWNVKGHRAAALLLNSSKIATAD